MSEFYSSGRIRCPKCGCVRPVGDSYELYGEGEHEIECSECEHKYKVSTSISITITSPELLPQPGAEE